MKITMKEKVLQFVEQKTEARFTDIQCFIFDTKYGAGSYLAGYQYSDRLVRNRESGDRKWSKRRRNNNRGYYCGAFSNGCFSKAQNTWIKGGYFLRGKNRLEKNPITGQYKVIRETLK